MIAGIHGSFMVSYYVTREGLNGSLVEDEVNTLSFLLALVTKEIVTCKTKFLFSMNIFIHLTPILLVMNIQDGSIGNARIKIATHHLRETMTILSTFIDDKLNLFPSGGITKMIQMHIEQPYLFSCFYFSQSNPIAMSGTCSSPRHASAYQWRITQPVTSR